MCFVCVAAASALAAACSSSRAATSPPPSPSATTATTTTAVTEPNKPVAGTNLRAKRYCEVLLVRPGNGDAKAEVYNTYPLNACPAAQWTKLVAKNIAAQFGFPIAILNGPRYWLMDGIEKAASNDRVHKTFGGIEMIREASVTVPSLADAVKPYTPHSVDRSTVFTFDAGHTVFELTAPDGARYVMQSWSQQVAPRLAESDLAHLGARLHLPAGWSFRGGIARQAAPGRDDDSRRSRAAGRPGQQLFARDHRPLRTEERMETHEPFDGVIGRTLAESTPSWPHARTRASRRRTSS